MVKVLRDTLDINLFPISIPMPLVVCLASFGNTSSCHRVIEESATPFERKGKGWLTAEYNMLPLYSYPFSEGEK